MKKLLLISTLMLSVASASAQLKPVQEGLNDGDQHGQAPPVAAPPNDNQGAPAAPVTHDPLRGDEQGGGQSAKGVMDPLGDDPIRPSGGGDPVSEPLDAASKLADTVKALDDEKEACKTKISYCNEVLNNPACQADHGWARAEIGRQNRRISRLEQAIKQLEDRMTDLEGRAAIVNPKVWGLETTIRGKGGVLDQMAELKTQIGELKKAPAQPKDEPKVPANEQVPGNAGNQTAAERPNWFMGTLGSAWDFLWAAKFWIIAITIAFFLGRFLIRRFTRQRIVTKKKP